MIGRAFNTFGRWATLCTAVAAAGALFWLFRADTLLAPDGSSVSRNRLTGELKICNVANECRTTPAIPAPTKLDPLWTAAMDLVDAQIEREQRIKSLSPDEIQKGNAEITRRERNLAEQLRQRGL